MSTCHFIFSGCHFFAKFKWRWRIKIFGGFSDLYLLNQLYWVIKWKGLGHSNVLFSTKETLQNADEAFDIRQTGHSHHEKQNQEYKTVNIWGGYMVEKLFLSINTYYISFCLFCFCRNCLLCFLNVIHIYQTAWFLTFRNIFSSNCNWSFDKGY